MGTKMHKKTYLIKMLRSLVYIAILMGLTSCGMINLTSSTFGALGGNGATGNEFEEFTDGESNLFSEGPVTMPVTTAKLESPNPQNITVTFSPDGSQSAAFAINLATNDFYDDELYYAENAPSGTFTVTGLEDSVPDTVNKVFIFNNRTGAEVVVEVEVDGSFQSTIAGKQDDSIFVASLSDAEDQISPFYEYRDDDLDGVYTVTETNAGDNMTFGTSLYVDNAGYSYFTLKDDDGTFDLWRRKSDGSFAELVVSGSDSEFRLIQAGDGDVVFAVLNNGGIIAFAQKSSSSLSDAMISASGNVPTSENFTITSLSESEIGEMVSHIYPSGAEIKIKDDESGIFELLEPGEINGLTRTYFLRFVPNDGSDATNIIDSSAQLDGSTVDRVVAALGPNNKLYVFAKSKGSGTKYSLFKLDVSDANNYKNAWDNRIVLVKDATSESVNYMQVSSKNDVFFSTGNGPNDEGGGADLIYWKYNGINISVVANMTDQDINASTKFVLSPDGESIVTCNQDKSGLAKNILIRHKLSYPSGVFVNLTNDLNYGSCTVAEKSYFVDSNNIVHYHRYDVILKTIQKAFLDLDKFDAQVDKLGLEYFTD